MIGPVTYLDVVIFAIPVLLGLIVMWRGVGRLLLSMLVRLLVSLFLGWVAASAAAIHVEISHAGLLDWASNQFGVSRFGALAGIRALVLVVVFALLMMVMGRIRAHLVGDDADVRVGAADRDKDRSKRGLLALVAAPSRLGDVTAESKQVVADPHRESPHHALDPFVGPDMLRRSITLPLIRHVSDTARSTLERLVPSSLGAR